MKHDTAFALTTFTVLLVDRAAKLLAGLLPQGGVPVLPGVLSLTPVENTGAGFGLFPGGRWFFIALAAVVAYAVLTNYREIVKDRQWAVTAGLILGGGLGNAVDRLVGGSVLDFINFHIWPAFNIADAALTLGGIGLIIALFHQKRANA